MEPLVCSTVFRPCVVGNYSSQRQGKVNQGVREVWQVFSQASACSAVRDECESLFRSQQSAEKNGSFWPEWIDCRDVYDKNRRSGAQLVSKFERAVVLPHESPANSEARTGGQMLFAPDCKVPYRQWRTILAEGGPREEKCLWPLVYVGQGEAGGGVALVDACYLQCWLV
jgi:hypothetical protein